MSGPDAAPGEQALAQSVVQGAAGSQEAFMALYRPRLLRCAAGFLGGQAAEADDMVQDSFLVAIPKLALRPLDQPLYLWLRGICMRLCYARRRSPDGVLLCLEDDLQAYMRRMDVERVASANAEVQKQQKLALLREIIKALEPDSRQLIQLRNVHGMTYAQIARVLGVSTAAIRPSLAAARLNIHRFVESPLAA